MAARPGQQIDVENSPTKGSGGLALVAQLQDLGASHSTIREVEKKVALSVTGATISSDRAPPDQRKPPPVRPAAAAVQPTIRVEIPRDSNGKITAWIEGMTVCDCGGKLLFTFDGCPLRKTNCP